MDRGKIDLGPALIRKRGKLALFQELCQCMIVHCLSRLRGMWLTVLDLENTVRLRGRHLTMLNIV